MIEAAAPKIEQLQSLLHKIITRIMRLLTRLRHLIEAEGIVYRARTDTDTDNVVAMLQAAASTWRIAQGPRAGRKVLTLVEDGARCGEPFDEAQNRRREAHWSRGALCANHQGL